MLPDADTDLNNFPFQPLSHASSHLPTLTTMSTAHLLPTYAHDHLQQLSLKLSVTNHLRILMHHMIYWIAAGRSGVQVINKRL